MRRRNKYLILGFVLVAFALAVWGFAIEPNRLIVVNHELRVRNWSPKLDNFKIVAVSDIHGGSNFIDEAKIREIVRLINEQNADIVVLLGDFVSQSGADGATLDMPMQTIAENLKGINARHGVYAVIGNHDGWYDTPTVRRELERVGYTVLENEAVAIEKDGEPLRIVGLPDLLSNNVPANGIENAKQGIDRLEQKAGKVLAVSHHPDDIISVTDKSLVSPDLVLFVAGHTHGGQVRFPFIGAPVIPSGYGRKYAAGFVRDEQTDVFVTTGVGTSLIPVRFGVPPEISVLSVSAER